MRIRFIRIILALILFTRISHAQHEQRIFHSIGVELDQGVDKDGDVFGADIDGWIGGDDDKFWIKHELDTAEGEIESSELWGLYSSTFSEFWDTQMGIRFDFDPANKGYLVFGLNGLAQYYFETQAHLFLSDDAEVSARFRQENEILLTQKLLLEPFIEMNLSAQDVEELGVKAGFTDAQIGLQLRYEVTRRFAPYIEIAYERDLGQTAHITLAEGERAEQVVGKLGVRLVL